MVGSLLLELRKTENIKRYQTRKMLFPRTVGEHTTSVAHFAFMLAQWQERKFGTPVNWREIYGRVLFHDALETQTGDILSPTKNYTPELKAELKKAEAGLYQENYSPLIPESWQSEMRRFMVDGKDDSLEGRILEAADLLDVVFEMQTELSYINESQLLQSDFVGILQLALIKLAEIDLPSVRYFLRYPLQDLQLQRLYPEGFEGQVAGYRFNERHFENLESIHKG
jgi:5'-deoxynucleotidase YfbR-like HD superfamily hydrolase